MTSTSTEIVARDPELDRFARLGKWLALAESKQTTPEAKGASSALRFYYAEALGLPPLAASELNVINGKLVVSALLLRALAEDRGYRIEQDHDASDDTTVTAALYMGEKFLGRSTFTIKDAERAGLVARNPTYKTYPGRMLWARAATNVIRDYAPAVAVGIITREELDVVDGEAVDLAPDIEFPVLDQTSEYEARQEVAGLPESEQAIVDALTEELGAAPAEGGDSPDNA